MKERVSEVNGRDGGESVTKTGEDRDPAVGLPPRMRHRSGGYTHIATGRALGLGKDLVSL